VTREKWFYLAALLLGASVWIVVCALSGRHEAWDSELYFSTAMPVVCAGSLALGFYEPARSWRWGVLPFVGQFATMLIGQGPGNLLPLGIVAFGIFSLPAVFAARVGAFFGVRRAPTNPS
jgi:hypothetical protein